MAAKSPDSRQSVEVKVRNDPSGHLNRQFLSSSFSASSDLALSWFRLKPLVVVIQALLNHASPQPIEMLFTVFVSEYLRQVFFQVEGLKLELAWCLFSSYDECVGACDTWPGAGEGRKKLILKWRERAIITFNRDELKRSTTSSLLSPPASPLNG